MTRARSISLASGVFTAGVLVFLLFALGGFTSPLPSTWEMQYTNLKDDLRALAVNPLDPQILYVGTDQALLGSTDGGKTWNQLNSFRDDKIDISDVLSDEAVQVLTDIGADAAQTSASAGQAEEAGSQERAAATGGREGAPAGTGGSSENQAAELAAQVEAAAQKMEETQDLLAQAEADYTEWTPDELTISEVDGIPEDDTGFVEQPMYDELANWLSERSLSVPDNGAERKDVLVDYLKAHEAEGDALAKAVDTAKSQSTNAEGEYNNLKAQLEQAQAAQEQAADQAEMETTEETQTESTEETASEPGAQPTPAFEGGYLTGVTDLAVNPANPDHVFVTTFDGVYRSPDGGQTWESIYTGANPRQGCCLCIAIDPSNPDIVLLGTLVGVGISKDGGVSWTRALGSLSNDVVTAVAVHPFDSSVILAGTQGDGIFKSTDGGDSWTKVFNNPSSGAQNIGAIAFAPTNPNIVYAGTQNGIYVSHDAGATWDTASGMGLGSYSAHDLAIDPTDSNTVLMASWDGVFGTTNGGSQWRRLTYGLKYRGADRVAFDPLTPETIWVLTDDHVFRGESPATVDVEGDGKAYLTGNCEFSFGGTERHTLTIINVDPQAQTVKIELRSEPQTVTLKVGVPMEVDLDGDGTKDALITLEKIDQGEPKISVYKVLRISAREESIQLKSAEEIRGLEDLEPYFAAEPSCVEVQDAASRWGEVHPEMIEDWREGARFRAFLPEVEIQYTYRVENDTATDSYDSYSREYDFYTSYGGNAEVSSSRGDEYTEGFYPSTSLGWPDTYEWFDSYSTYDESAAYQSHQDYEGNKSRDEHRTREGSRDRNAKAWKFQLDWYLGDFLFERQQLYISKEARDLVELRQDILEQVTMYYFDRKAARIDMIMNPPADSYSKLDMLLRLQQLDASLDALTGGYFTSTIKERRAQYPELPVY